MWTLNNRPVIFPCQLFHHFHGLSAATLLLTSSVLTAPENHLLVWPQMGHFSIQKSTAEPPPLRFRAPSCPPGAQIHLHPDPSTICLVCRKLAFQQLLPSGGRTILGKSSQAGLATTQKEISRENSFPGLLPVSRTGFLQQ